MFKALFLPQNILDACAMGVSCFPHLFVFCFIMLIHSGVAGYVAAGMYKKMEGEHWVWNINLTSCLFACELTSKSACFFFYSAHNNYQKSLWDNL